MSGLGDPTAFATNLAWRYPGKPIAITDNWTWIPARDVIRGSRQFETHESIMASDHEVDASLVFLLPPQETSSGLTARGMLFQFLSIPW